MRRWAAAPKSFTLGTIFITIIKNYRNLNFKFSKSSDFGDYDDDVTTLLTDEGEQMSQQIAGYIDILLKKRQGHRKEMFEILEI